MNNYTIMFKWNIPMSIHELSVSECQKFHVWTFIHQINVQTYFLWQNLIVTYKTSHSNIVCISRQSSNRHKKNTFCDDCTVNSHKIPSVKHFWWGFCSSQKGICVVVILKLACTNTHTHTCSIYNYFLSPGRLNFFPVGNIIFTYTKKKMN